jgi:hypothetical protein
VLVIAHSFPVLVRSSSVRDPYALALRYSSRGADLCGKTHASPDVTVSMEPEN